VNGEFKFKEVNGERKGPGLTCLWLWFVGM